VVLAHADGTDWILCQITSNRYRDRDALRIAADAIVGGSLRTDSYARPKRLFTANEAIFVGQIGQLPLNLHRDLVRAVAALFVAPS
jgi:mRNA interferase MazF